MPSQRRHDPAGSGRNRHCVVFVHIPRLRGAPCPSLVLNYPSNQTIRLDLVDRPAVEIETEITLDSLLSQGYLGGYGLPVPCGSVDRP